MKTFLSPVTRVCAEIVEMTSSVTQGAWPRGRASSVAAIGEKRPEKAVEHSTPGVTRRPAIIGQARVPAGERSPVSEIADRKRISFDVASFCLELDAWRMSLTPHQASAAAIEHHSSTSQNLPALQTRLDGVAASASLENEVTNAIRRIEHGSDFGPVARLARRA